MQKYKILWADDEIDLLKPHILFLENKGYEVKPVISGGDAIEACANEHFDVVFLDENMPGKSGIESLDEIKAAKPSLPVVMITKSEEEQIMEQAIGAKISDYLIKPLNPNQILLSVKKILENKRLISEKTTISYQQDFRNISMAFNDQMDHEEWAEVYKKLVYWELEIENTSDASMQEVLESQKEEANVNFYKFIANNYHDWLNDPDADRPLLSHELMREKVFPKISDDKPLFVFIIDNFRYDQWRAIADSVEEYFNIKEESSYYSILPTTTAYARNAIFSGMMPLQMANQHKDLWVGEDDDDSKNNYEEQFLERQLKKNKLDIDFSYHKIFQTHQGKKFVDQIPKLWKTPLNVVVYNFVDMLSHARTDLQMIRELAPDESAYRSLAKSWFLHSPLMEAIKEISENGGKLIITTDHGTVRVRKPVKIVGDRHVNTNLRFKQGKNLSYDGGKVFTLKKPEEFNLPKYNVSTSYVFATQNQFFVYPNNYNYYANYFHDTFQHGGISLEEMIIPYVYLEPK